MRENVRFVICSHNLQQLLPNWKPLSAPPLSEWNQPDYVDRKQFAEERNGWAFGDFINEVQPTAQDTPVRILVENGARSVPGGNDLDTVQIKATDGQRRSCTPDELRVFTGYLEATIIPAIPLLDAYYETWRAKKNVLGQVAQNREERCQTWLRDLPAVNSREAYERECARVNVIPQADETLTINTYGLEYGNFDQQYMSDVPYTFFSSVLAQRYYRSVLRPALEQHERELTAQRTTEQRSTEVVVCPGCKNPTPKALMMSASLGTVCPDCYDKYSG